jgi:hypothetical protein
LRFSLAWSRARDVDGFLLVVRKDRQRAECGRGDLAGQTPAVADPDLALAHEEPKPVLEHRHGRRPRLPQVRIVVLGGRIRLVGPHNRRLTNQQAGNRNGRCRQQPACRYTIAPETPRLRSHGQTSSDRQGGW